MTGDAATVFAVSGIVIGPAALAVTMGLLDVWRLRLGSTQAPDVRADRDEVPAEPGGGAAP